MKYFIEITILPGTDLGFSFLWYQLFKNLHLAFVGMKEHKGSVTVGVGFPEYLSKPSGNLPGFPLGSRLRLFAQSKEDLLYLNIDNRLRGFKDYIHIRSIQNVPDNINSYCCFRRLPVKTNKEILARRRVKRHGRSYDQALKDYKDFQPKIVKSPYIHVHSASNGGRFPMYIVKEERNSQEFEGFGTYGLSRVSTVPEF